MGVTLPRRAMASKGLVRFGVVYGVKSNFFQRIKNRVELVGILSKEFVKEG